MSAVIYIYNTYNLHVRVNFLRVKFIGHTSLKSTNLPRLNIL
jgi:hypothetical protein